MKGKQFPEIYKTLYRGVRAGISAGVVAVMALKIDISDPKEALKIILLVFGTGFLVSFGKWAREKLDEWMGYDANSLISKVMPI